MKMHFTGKGIFLAVFAICAAVAAMLATFALMIAEIEEYFTVGENKEITSGSEYNDNPSLVWTGNNYGIVWFRSNGNLDLASANLYNANGSIYFTILDKNGNRLNNQFGQEIEIGQDSTGSSNNAIVWTGTEYGILWNKISSDRGAQNIVLTRINGNGQILSTDTIVTHATDIGPVCLSLVWTGTEYGIAWSGENAEHIVGTPKNIFFTKLGLVRTNNDTIVINPEDIQRIPVQVSIATYSGADSRSPDCPSLVWTGREYGIVWRENSEIHFTRLNANGNRLPTPQAADVIIARNNCVRAYIAWADESQRYGVVWGVKNHSGMCNAFFTRLNKDGIVLGSEIHINRDKDAESIALTCKRKEYGILWHSNSELYVSRIDVNGNRIGDDVIIPNTNADIGNIGPANSSYSYYPTSLSWDKTNNKYGIAWTEVGNDCHNIYFTNAGPNNRPIINLIVAVNAEDPRRLLYALHPVKFTIVAKDVDENDILTASVAEGVAGLRGCTEESAVQNGQIWTIVLKWIPSSSDGGGYARNSSMAHSLKFYVYDGKTVDTERKRITILDTKPNLVIEEIKAVNSGRNGKLITVRITNKTRDFSNGRKLQGFETFSYECRSIRNPAMRIEKPIWERYVWEGVEIPEGGSVERKISITNRNDYPLAYTVDCHNQIDELREDDNVYPLAPSQKLKLTK